MKSLTQSDRKPVQWVKGVDSPTSPCNINQALQILGISFDRFLKYALEKKVWFTTSCADEINDYLNRRPGNTPEEKLRQFKRGEEECDLCLYVNRRSLEAFRVNKHEDQERAEVIRQEKMDKMADDVRVLIGLVQDCRKAQILQEESLEGFKSDTVELKARAATIEKLIRKKCEGKK